MFGLIITLVILVLLIIGIVLIYNSLVQKRALVENGWSDIEVQLKRRAREMNIKVKSVPSNFVAGPFGFHIQPFFEIEPADYAAPDVSFEG